ncbi:ATP-binding cassette domain-containing protein [Geitlerinema splendidum]|nr:ATP-binding cassette domain-containing protein [Geitlerinema splendidum]
MSLDLLTGDSYAVMGQAGSGKSTLLNLISGKAKPVSGTVTINDSVVTPVAFGTGRKVTPLSIAQSHSPKGGAERVVRALTALDLAEDRDTPVTRLSPVQRASCEILPCLVKPSPVAVIDGYLDLFDPWTRSLLFDFIEADKEAGRAFVVATGNVEVAEALNNLIILVKCEALFAGTVRELIDRCRPSELVVDCEDATTVINMVEPFSVSVNATPGRLEITAHRGQELAAKLLTFGYGNIKSVVVKEPTLEEAILTVR